MNATTKRIIKTLNKEYFQLRPGFIIIYASPGIERLIIAKPDTWQQTEIKMGRYCIKVGWGYQFIYAGCDKKTNILVLGS